MQLSYNPFQFEEIKRNGAEIKIHASIGQYHAILTYEELLQRIQSLTDEDTTEEFLAQELKAKKAYERELARDFWPDVINLEG